MKINLKSLETVEFKNSLNKHFTQASLEALIITKVESIPEYTGMKLNPELIVFISTVIEQAILDNKTKGVDKQTMFLNIYEKLFELTDIEKVCIIQILEFLLTNKLIKVADGKYIKFIKRICSSIASNLFTGSITA